MFLTHGRWLAEERTRWPRYRNPKPGPAHALAIDQLGRIRSEEVAAQMLEMAAGSKARKAATAWLLRHAAFARPTVEAAVGGDLDATARTLLAKMH